MYIHKAILSNHLIHLIRACTENPSLVFLYFNDEIVSHNQIW